MNLLNEKIVDALNYRIQQEEHSYRIYEQMAMWLENQGLTASAKLYYNYAQEELKHASFSKTFLLSYDVKPCLMPLPSPEIAISGIETILNATLEHELLTTAQCQSLFDLAKELNHAPLQTLAYKYCEEQIEEINKATNNISAYRNCGGINMIFDNYIKENYD